MNRKTGRILVLFILVFATLLLINHYSGRILILNHCNYKIYDFLAKIKYKFTPLNDYTKDITLVSIDNQTLDRMPSRWPYPRSDFAKAIEHLNRANAKIIAFDFQFFGRSTVEDDELLKNALQHKGNIILANTVDEQGFIGSEAQTKLNGVIQSGFVTKLQDNDGVIRSNLIYLLRSQNDKKGFLSWEAQLLKNTESIDLNSIVEKNDSVELRNNLNKEWSIPVEKNTKSFLINYRAHTKDFNRISFYEAVNGSFNPALAENKIILVGPVSTMLADIHNTPLGYMPGLTINANAFLTLYKQTFIKRIPFPFEIIIILLGNILAIIFIPVYPVKKAIFLIILEIIFFFLISWALFLSAYIWDYFTFPATIVLFSIIAKKLLD